MTSVLGSVTPVISESARVLQTTAARTRHYDFTVWFWGDAIALDGLLDAAELIGDTASLTHAQRFLLGSAGRAFAWNDHLMPGSALLRLHEFQPSCEVITEATRLAEWLKSVPHASSAPLYRPDQPAYRHTVWVDSLYHVPPFLARLAIATDDSRYAVRALEVWRTHVGMLSDTRGPFLAHSYDTATHVRHGYGWARGTGWALLGMVDTLRLMSDATDDSIAEFRALAEAVRQAQDVTGFWRTLLHDRESYLESSATAFFGAAFTAGVASGLLPDIFGDSAELAWSAIRGRIDDDGACWGVSACTWAGLDNVNDDVMYKTLPTETNAWGQGSVLRFAAERVRAGLT